MSKNTFDKSYKKAVELLDVKRLPTPPGLFKVGKMPGIAFRNRTKTKKRKTKTKKKKIKLKNLKKAEKEIINIKEKIYALLVKTMKKKQNFVLEKEKNILLEYQKQAK